MSSPAINEKFKMVEENIFTNLENVSGAAYDNKARAYEKLVSSNLYNKIIWGTLPIDYTDFARKAILSSTGTSLDIGCGGLVQTSTIYAESTQKCILLDHSIEMLKIAKKDCSIFVINFRTISTYCKQMLLTCPLKMKALMPFSVLE